VRWTQKFPTEPGEYLLAFKNTKNGMEGFKLIEIKDCAACWLTPGTDEMVFLGSHLEIRGVIKLTFPK